MRMIAASKTKTPPAILIPERFGINEELSIPASGRLNPAVTILNTGLTKRGEAIPIRMMKPTEINWGKSIDLPTSDASDAFADLGQPRKTIPNALVKQNIARPPISERATIEPRMITDW